MRFLLYNIRYGTGGGKFCFPWSGYFKHTDKNLQRIIEFVRPLNAHIIGLVEVDAGSYRCGKKNQAQTVAEALGHYHTYRSKYSDSGMWGKFPLMNKQGNAFLSRDTIQNERFHYFDRGVKRLVIELELEKLVVFLVHLSLTYRVRHNQLSDLYNLVEAARKPCIVAGDFNSLWGEKEIHLFLAASGLLNADPQVRPSFPSHQPCRHLDFILHSPELQSERFWMPDVTFSDHRPLVWDFSVRE